ncbi:MAG: SAM-dependent methyltransferase, partial [Candidatus Acidiferrales bacterium]
AALGRAQDKQDKSLAEIAAEAKRKKQESARPVLTNDELGTAAPALPAVRVLRRSEHIPALAPFVPTPMPTVEAMLELASVREGEVVFDVGSGDGRIVIAAAELLGARAVGIEVDEALVARSRKTVEEKGLAERVRIIHANALDVDLSPADVVTLYLTPDGLKVLRPHLEKTLRPGTRVVSHDFQILGWELAERRRVDGKEIYLYRVP